MSNPAVGQLDLDSIVGAFCSTGEMLRQYLEDAQVSGQQGRLTSKVVLKKIVPAGTEFFEVTADTVKERHFQQWGAALMSFAKVPRLEALGERRLFSGHEDAQIFASGDAGCALLLEGMFWIESVRWFVLHTGQPVEYLFVTKEVLHEMKAMFTFIKTPIKGYATTLDLTELRGKRVATSTATRHETALRTVEPLEAQEVFGIGLRDEREPEFGG
jgi:hypothetical protein